MSAAAAFCISCFRSRGRAPHQRPEGGPVDLVVVAATGLPRRMLGFKREQDRSLCKAMRLSGGSRSDRIGDAGSATFTHPRSLAAWPRAHRRVAAASGRQRGRHRAARRTPPATWFRRSAVDRASRGRALHGRFEHQVVEPVDQRLGAARLDHPVVRGGDHRSGVALPVMNAALGKRWRSSRPTGTQK